MHLPTMKRFLLLLLIGNLGAMEAAAQGGGGSPYSAYGLGDMLATGQATQAMMGGTGLAITEPYSVVTGNPAGYVSLARPVFDVGVSIRTTRSSSVEASSTRKDARFTGFAIGVPFGAGKWGMAMGLTPFSEVDYAMVRATEVEGYPVKYKYSGSGGLDKAFFGLGRNLYQQRADSIGNMGMRVALGADFNFLFGSVEQTREAVYPRDAGYNNVRAFSALVLRSPTAAASLIWQGDLTKKRNRDDDNWRWSVGLSASMPAEFRAKYNGTVTTYVETQGFETVRDTVAEEGHARGSISVPAGIGLGLGVLNGRWAATVQMQRRNWGAAKMEVPGYVPAAPMRDAVTYAAALRFRPGGDGGLFKRTAYRLGIRHEQTAQEVRGQELTGSTISAGVSIPLNAVQTNSWLNLGGEYGLRGTTDNGLLRERHAALWLGVSFTPWRGERWFVPSKIQ